jgi:hypothetical protein
MYSVWKSQREAFEHFLAKTSTTLSEAQFLKQVVLLELTTIKNVLKSNQPTKKNPWCAAVKEFTKMYQASDPFYDRLKEVFQERERNE